MLRKRLPVALLALLAAGSVQAGLFDDEEARKQITDLKAEAAAGQKQLDGKIGQLDEKIGRLDVALKDRAVDLAQLIDGVRQEMTKLRGQIEVMVNRADTLERRQKDLYDNLDTRFRRLEQSLQTFQEKVAAPEREAQKEKEAYESALNQFKVGNYQASVAAFQTFMVNYPNSPLVPAAQYWIGNAYYATRDYKMAIATQQKVVASWPDNAKAPDAMLNVASAQAELGDQKSARETMRVLMQRYPASPAAEEAKQRLQKR